MNFPVAESHPDKLKRCHLPVLVLFFILSQDGVIRRPADAAGAASRTDGGREHILSLPEEIRKWGFILEAFSLYTPILVESDEVEKIARDQSEIEPEIPLTILTFFSKHQMKDVRIPNTNTKDMVEAYRNVKSPGLKRVGLGNLGVFVHEDEDRDYLVVNIDTSTLLINLTFEIILNLT